MPSVTVQKSIAYSDATTSTPYDLGGTVTIPCSVPYRDYHSLSPSSSTLLIQNGEAPIATGDIKYMLIYNTGANSAYIAIQPVSGSAIFHEIPTGTVFDFFGQRIMDTGNAPGGLIDTIFAKGNTTIEVDIFM